MACGAIVPNQVCVIGHIRVLPDSVSSGYGQDFFTQSDSSPAVIRSIDPFRPFFNKDPDEELILTGDMGMGATMHMAMKASATEHLIPGDANQMGIEWTDHMADTNAASTTENIRWIIRDQRTGLENQDIFWHFKTGDKVMIRMYNDPKAMHPMAHSIHFHGQRFLVVNVNGIRVPDMAWKDTFLIGTGSTVDLLLDASNPGGWMAHCHIAEHMEDMMMFYFHVGD